MNEKTLIQCAISEYILSCFYTEYLYYGESFRTREQFLLCG